jgi:hypothetical protein
MPADPISLITAPARLGLRLAFLPLRVLRGAAGAVLGGDAEEDRFVPTAEPTTAGDRAPAAAEAPPRPRQPQPRRKPPARKRAQAPTKGQVARMREEAREAEASAGGNGNGDPGPGAEIHVEAPWPDYDELSLSDLLLRIEQATPTEKAVARLYERQSANREAVLHQTEKP